MKASAIALCTILAACSSVELAPRTVKTRIGPAHQEPIRRIVSIRASCGSLSSFNRGDNTTTAASTEDGLKNINRSDAVQCTDEQVDGVDQVVRSALEFYGYSVIDSERLNATTMQRRAVLIRETNSDAGGSTTNSTSDTTIKGAGFLDAPPTIQDEILAELGAEGLVSARVLVGAPIARSPRRHVDVQVRLLHVKTGNLVWASRCRVEAGWTVNEEPIMEAAQCAVDSITGVAR